MHNRVDAKGRTPTQRSWASMIQRCSDPGCGSYERYGGAGITVCKRWLEFENFLADMGERPDNMTLDRIKSSKNYCPSNCRWATEKVQNSNRPDYNRKIEHQGKSLTIAEWSRRLKIRHTTLTHRLDVGWSVKRALTTPVKHYRYSK